MTSQVTSHSRSVSTWPKDSKISPMIDLDEIDITFTSHRINQPITDYANDFRVNTVKDDPNKFFYVTKNIRLENWNFNSSLSGRYLSEDSDIRAFML